MSKRHYIKIYFSEEKLETLRKRFPRGAMQKIARAAFEGSAPPAVPSEERRLHAATQRLLAYVGQQFNDLLEQVDEINSIDIDSDLELKVEKLCQFYADVRRLAQEITGEIPDPPQVPT